MFGLQFDISVTETLDWDSVAKRRWPKIIAAGLLESMDWWRRHYLELHWTARAQTKYRHDPRTPDWISRRQELARRGEIREGGGNIDNLVTGLFRELVTGWYELRARGGRVTFRCYGPRYVTLRPKGGKGPWKWGEVTTTTENEERTMGQRLLNAVVKGIAANPKRTTKKL